MQNYPGYKASTLQHGRSRPPQLLPVMIYCESPLNAQSQTHLCVFSFSSACSVRSAVRHIFVVWSANVVASNLEYIMHLSVVTTAPNLWGKAELTTFTLQCPGSSPTLKGHTDGYNPALSPAPHTTKLHWG